ncbi:MAG: hypothetical protein M2R45_04649 [Verrucomicrobia subdivision 3 bacterium]|nr:hypothetical protein [Limisphaerales bacterium]MCS1417141.1 hypothetical protein [Limisphaerales bacterium]
MSDSRVTGLPGGLLDELIDSAVLREIQLELITVASNSGVASLDQKIASYRSWLPGWGQVRLPASGAVVRWRCSQRAFGVF